MMEINRVIHKLDFMRSAYQKLIDEKVDAGRFVGTDITGTWKADTPLDDAYKEHIEALTLAISDLEKKEQDRWIPVKENPKEPERIFDTYLVYTKYERFGIADYFGGGGWNGYDVDGDQIDELEIAAWRPLPAPYQEGEA